MIEGPLDVCLRISTHTVEILLDVFELVLIQRELGLCNAQPFAIVLRRTQLLSTSRGDFLLIPPDCLFQFADTMER